MSESFTLRYVDRYSGRVETERIFARRFLLWSYNHPIGLWLTRSILCRPYVSRLAGWVARRRCTRYLVAPFARRMGIDPQDCPGGFSAFESFDAFFVRRLPPGRRSVPIDPDACVSPVDARLRVVTGLAPEREMNIKHQRFSVARLLGDEILARQFAGGTAVICRLGLADYHHVHFPASGIPGVARPVSGKLYAGGPYAKRRPMPRLSENHRVITSLQTKRFGRVVMVEVGAFTVGSIHQLYRAGRRVDRGEPKSRFHVGGSTVVLLVARGRLRVARDLMINSRRGLETRVRMGDVIGRARSPEGG